LLKSTGRRVSGQDADRRRDLDETRGLAYAMLAKRPSSRDPVLLATLVNALARHGLGVHADVAIRQLSAIDQGHPGPSDRWLRDQIERINTELGS